MRLSPRKPTPNRHIKHILIVNWKDITHPAAGGAEVFCDQVARELLVLGYQVTMLTSRGRAEDPPRDEIAGYQVRRLGRTYTVYLLALLWLFKHRGEVDAVIDSQNGIPFFTPLTARRGTPIAMLIHHVHQEQFLMYFPPPVARVGRWLERTGSRAVYGPRAVCTVSPSSRSEIRRALGLTGPIYLVPNGSAAGQVVAPRLRAGVPTITCVGRLVTHKRWHLLVDAATALRTEFPDLVVNLVGAGPELETLQRYVAHRGVGDVVTLHGFVSAERRDALLGSAWLTVSTSVGEGWGLSMIEAAATGVPAVAIDVPGLRDSVREDVTGWLAKENDLDSVIAIALRALADPEEAAGYESRCRLWARSLQWAATAERFEAVLLAEAATPGRSAQRRRSRSDIATVIDLPVRIARTLVLDRLVRITDQATFCPTCVDHVPGPWRILLYGADEHGALRVLRRAGVDPRDPDISLRLCRPSDLLSWTGHAVSHSRGGPGRPARCRAEIPGDVLTDDARAESGVRVKESLT